MKTPITPFQCTTYRGRRALEHRKNVDQDRMDELEKMLKETRTLLVESQRKCDEVMFL